VQTWGAVKRTRKWAFVGQEAQRLAGLGLTPLEIATKLDLEKSTVTRWFAAGKLAKGKARSVAKRRRNGVPRKPALWAADVRKEYQLDSTDDLLVTMAQQAAAAALDAARSDATQSQARRDFLAITHRLKLGSVERAEQDLPTAPGATHSAKAPPVVARPARAGGDPRALFKVVPK
jgi:hypothetical protein